MKTQKPEWIKKVRRNLKARERYFLKRYGSLDRMHAIDEKFQAWMDEWSFADEMKAMEEAHPGPAPVPRIKGTSPGGPEHP